MILLCNAPINVPHSVLMGYLHSLTVSGVPRYRGYSRRGRAKVIAILRLMAPSLRLVLEFDHEPTLARR